jgi:hypothetical protein
LSRNGIVFYVGYTLNTKSRLSSHKSKFGNDIELSIIDEYYGADDTARALELFWIKKYRDLGVNICNIKGKDEGKCTYTFASYPSIIEAAKELALEEGTTLSEKIHQFLLEYIAADELIEK